MYKTTRPYLLTNDGVIVDASRGIIVNMLGSYTTIKEFNSYRLLHSFSLVPI